MGIQGTHPTHDLCVAERLPDGSLGRKGKVGVGWLNADGSMSISLNPGTVLDWRDNVIINLFEREPWGRKKKTPNPKPPPQTPTAPAPQTPPAA